MKILLDTGVLLGWLEGSMDLADVSDPENTIFVSAVSLWEIWLKVSSGKLRVPEDFESLLAAEWFENLPLSAAQSRYVAFLPWIHRDPFDRMLVAQAQSERLILLTTDAVLAGYGDYVRVVA